MSKDKSQLPPAGADVRPPVGAWPLRLLPFSHDAIVRAAQDSIHKPIWKEYFRLIAKLALENKEIPLDLPDPVRMLTDSSSQNLLRNVIYGGEDENGECVGWIDEYKFHDKSIDNAIEEDVWKSRIWPDIAKAAFDIEKDGKIEFIGQLESVYAPFTRIPAHTLPEGLTGPDIDVGRGTATLSDGTKVVSLHVRRIDVEEDDAANGDHAADIDENANVFTENSPSNKRNKKAEIALLKWFEARVNASPTARTFTRADLAEMAKSMGVSDTGAKRIWKQVVTDSPDQRVLESWAKGGTAKVPVR